MTTLKQSAFLLLFLLLAAFATAQNTQTLRGQILDKQSELPLIGVAVELISVEPVRGEATDLDGYFTLQNVPLGRHTVRVSYLGYNSVTIPNVVVTAGKEVILNIGLEESVVQMNEKWSSRLAWTKTKPATNSPR